MTLLEKLKAKLARAQEIKAAAESADREYTDAEATELETLAADCETDMSAAWSVDDTFFTLTRDKEALNGMVGELAGKAAAKEHLTSTAKTQKAVINACLDGTRISKVENCTPRYMQVPMQGYTSRCGFGEAKVEAVEDTAIAAE